MKKIIILYFSLILNFTQTTVCINQYYCTAADHKYFNHLINLVGSLHSTNFDNTQEIAVFNLGLQKEQIDQLNAIEKVKVYEVELTNPDLLKPIASIGNKIGWYAWKPVIIKQSLRLFPYVLYLDAGTTILHNLDNLFRYIKEQGYFLATIGDETKNGEFLHNVRWQTTQYIVNKYNLTLLKNQWIFTQEAVIGGLIGVSQNAQDYFINDLHELTSDLRNFEDDGTAPNGFGTARHDQSILSILAYLKSLIIHKQDHTQKIPINLELENKNAYLYITWNGSYVTNKTDIYNSRGDLKNLAFYKSQISYKNEK
jgi:hypothetical protein